MGAEGGGGNGLEGPGVDFAGRLTPAELDELRKEGAPRRFRRGTTIFHNGDESDHVFLLEGGRVKIGAFDEDGTEHVLGISESGELLGELSAIDGQARSATAIAIDDVEAVVIPAIRFQAFIESRPRVASVLLRSVISRLRESDRKRLEFGAHDTVGRVARRLVEMGERFGEEEAGVVRVRLPISQEELAAWTGSSREAVVRALRSMRSCGWIETARREVRILDLDALARRAR